MRISDWSSDVCSSDLLVGCIQGPEVHFDLVPAASEDGRSAAGAEEPPGVVARFALDRHRVAREYRGGVEQGPVVLAAVEAVADADTVRRPRCRESNAAARSEEHTSELQSLMRISYAGFCSK